MINICDIYWAAGFIDGEGSFTLAGKNPRVSVPQLDDELLLRLKSLFTGWIYKKRDISNKLSSNGISVWGITGSRAVGVMMTLYPLMSQKRKRQIEKVLLVWKSTPNSTGSGHYKVKTSDEDAIIAMKRVVSGESMTSVAKSIGYNNHTTVCKWMSGTDRPYLLAKLKGETQL